MEQLKNENWIGKVCFFIEETNSTNDLLHNLVKEEKVPSGTVLHTDYQRRGKGQRGSTWLGNKGENIAMSIYFDQLGLSHNQSFKLNQITALSVAEALSNELNKPILIKWPNDIYYKHEKLGGILIELSSQGSIVSDAIIGIGINAGHDLNLDNLNYYCKEVKNVLEVSIGHALICDALYFGLEDVISMYLKQLK